VRELIRARICVGDVAGQSEAEIRLRASPKIVLVIDLVLVFLPLFSLPPSNIENEHD
jgi:hypothetical protein